MGFLSKLLVGAIGFYAGVYCDQNYKLPSVSEPAQLLDEVNKWLEEYKNQKPKVGTKFLVQRYVEAINANELLI